MTFLLCLIQGICGILMGVSWGVLETNFNQINQTEFRNSKNPKHPDILPLTQLNTTTSYHLLGIKQYTLQERKNP